MMANPPNKESVEVFSTRFHKIPIHFCLYQQPLLMQGELEKRALVRN